MENRTPTPKIPRPLMFMIVFGMAVLAVALTASPAHSNTAPAQGDIVPAADLSLAPAADLSIERQLFHPSSHIPFLTITVRNNPVSGRPPTVVRDIVVRVTSVCPCTVDSGSVVGFTTLDNGYQNERFGSASLPTLGKFDSRTGLWTIPVLAPSGEAEITFNPSIVNRTPPGIESPVRFHAEIIAPLDPPDYRANNQTEAWYVKRDRYFHRFALGDAGVLVRVTDREPAKGTQTTFEVTAKLHDMPLPHASIHTNSVSRGVWNMQVKIDVTPGLSIDPMVQAPAGTSFDPDTSIWQLGTTETIPAEQTLQIPVNVTSDDTPLVQRCLTATVVHAVPSFTRDTSYTQENDIATVCLGQERRVVLNSGWSPLSALWSLHDCVGATARQSVTNAGACGNEDEVKVLAKIERSRMFQTTTIEGGLYGQLGGIDQPTVYLEPESVIVQVPVPDGRFRRASNSFEQGGVLWQTWRWSRQTEVDFNFQPGLVVRWSRAGFDPVIADWMNLQSTFSVAGLDGGDPPGRVKVRRDDRDANVFVDLNPTTQPPYTHQQSYPLTFTEREPWNLFVQFERLGTYVVTHGLVANRQNTSDNPNSYSDTGNEYVFHVGPISELGVRDGGASPLAGTGQQAYTVLAVNNGPDTAPDATVTLSGVPQGAEAVFTDGSYRETSCGNGVCDAVWDLGEIPPSASRLLEGRTEFATLTLIAGAGAPAPITATIANTEDYSVCLDGADEVTPTPTSETGCHAAGGDWHSIDYFDYLDDNDSVTIAGRSGTGPDAPGRPVVGAQLYTLPPIGLVRWDPVEVVNLHPVSHYQVWAAGAGCEPPDQDDTPAVVEGTVFVDYGIDVTERVCYYVRAVNNLGGVGYWSPRAEAFDPTGVTPKLSVRGQPAVGEGATVYFTVSAFPAPAVGDPLTVHYTVSQQGDFLAAGESGRKQVTLDNRGEARIGVQTQNDQLEETNGSVIVTLNDGTGYGLSSAHTASVMVTDDETSEINFVPNQNEATVGEGSGRFDVPVVINYAPAADLVIDYTIGGTATPGEDFTIAGSTGNAGSVTARAGNTTVNIPVQIINDRLGEKHETIVFTLKDTDDYNLHWPVTYTLTITDNDGPRVEFLEDKTSTGRERGAYGVDIKLDPAPTDETI